MTQEAHTLNRTYRKEIYMNYLVHLPPVAAASKWPVIFFLHGAGERGDDLHLVKKHGIARIVEEQPQFGFITISPQCPNGTWWPAEIDALNLLYDTVMRDYPVNKRQVYLTGLSMGGYGSWHWAALYPTRFAAVVPICGGGHWAAGFPEKVTRLKSTPVWAFHGAKDDVVPLSETTTLVDALKEAGGNVKLTVYPRAKHDSWTKTYTNPELYRWLLEQEL